MNILSKVATSSLQINQYKQHSTKTSNRSSFSSSLPLSPSLPILPASGYSENNLITMEYNLKLNSLKCIVSVLRSLVSWSQEGLKTATTEFKELRVNENQNNISEYGRDSRRPSFGFGSIPTDSIDYSNNMENSATDDPEIFEALKHRKNTLSECIKKFNFKPQKVFLYR